MNEKQTAVERLENIEKLARRSLIVTTILTVIYTIGFISHVALWNITGAENRANTEYDRAQNKANTEYYRERDRQEDLRIATAQAKIDAFRASGLGMGSMGSYPAKPEKGPLE